MKIVDILNVFEQIDTKASFSVYPRTQGLAGQGERNLIFLRNHIPKIF